MKMDDLESNDLEYREERKEQVQPVKKHIPLKLKITNQQPQAQHSSQDQHILNQFQFNPIIPNSPLSQSLNNDLDPINNQKATTPNKKMKLTHSDLFDDVDDRPMDSVKSKIQNKIEKLNWSYNVSQIGKKVYENFLFPCDICSLPILIYGRMMPCKHVFCIKCAYENAEKCVKSNCQSLVERIEEATHGQIFICTYGKVKDLCGRSYMSMRDLNAHIEHRHVDTNDVDGSGDNSNRVNNLITIMTAKTDSTAHLFPNNSYNRQSLD